MCCCSDDIRCKMTWNWPQKGSREKVECCGRYSKKIASKAQKWKSVIISPSRGSKRLSFKEPGKEGREAKRSEHLAQNLHELVRGSFSILATWAIRENVLEFPLNLISFDYTILVQEWDGNFMQKLPWHDGTYKSSKWVWFFLQLLFTFLSAFSYFWTNGNFDLPVLLRHNKNWVILFRACFYPASSQK